MEFKIDFKDKRRVQRGMFAENKEEVENYISKKYRLNKSDFKVLERDKNEEFKRKWD